VDAGKKVRSYRQYRSVLLPLGGFVRELALSPIGTHALSRVANDPALRLWSLRD
jgi:hypothetical protein